MGIAIPDTGKCVHSSSDNSLGKERSVEASDGSHCSLMSCDLSHQRVHLNKGMLRKKKKKKKKKRKKKKLNKKQNALKAMLVVGGRNAGGRWSHYYIRWSHLRWSVVGGRILPYFIFK